MATIPSMRHTETDSADAGPAAVLRGPAPARTAAAVAAVAAVFLGVVALSGVGRLDATMPAFLEEALGPETAEAPLERTPATGVGVRINDHGYTVSHWGVSLSVTSEDVGGSDWRRHVHGVTRDTEFGAETIVVNGRETEELLTVSERQGTKTWRWKLASRLHPRVGRDGAVTFLDPTRHRVTTLVIDPVRILDTGGEDVTPDGLRWGLEEANSGWVLTLKLDDADLPLPYVIDPSVTHRAAQTATTAAGTSLTVNVPAGVQANDLLVAHIARVGNAAINTPSGWTAAGGTNNGSSLRQATFYRVASASEPASYTWTWTGTQAAAGGMSAYYGVKASAPLDVIGTATTGNNTTTITAPSITTGANEALVLAFFSSNTNSTYSTATGMSERYEVGAIVAASVASDDMAQASAGATGNKTSTTSVSGRVIGHQVSFNVDDVAPTGSLTDPGSPLAGTVVLTANAADGDSAVAGVRFQRSPANAGAWTDIGAADTTSPYTASFDTTAVTDGLYDLRVVITDVAGNVTNSTIIEDRLVDNTAPALATTFPAASGTYNVAGWEGGCPTIGLCGTHSDAGSGVSQVQVSIRQDTGSYWNGSGFSSGAEVWNTANLSAGDWSYPFPAAGFPASGSYTVRVRAVDGAGNTESPSSRTFTIDPVAPQATIDSSPPNPTGSTSADFGFSADELGSTFECRLDGGSWSPCTSPRSYTSFADGSHTFDVRATDAAGNQDGSAGSYTWLVDTTAPSSTTTFPAAGGEYNAAGWTAGCAGAGLCGTYSDGTGSGVSQVQVSIRQGTGSYWNGSGFSSGSEVWNAASLAAGTWSLAFPAANLPTDGAYTVRVRAVDAVGNAETPSSRTFTYDTVDPSSLVSFPASGGSYTDTAWNAGCPTNGLCGTHSDSGTGVQAVQVSVRRDATALYWDGSSFSAGAEVFLDASLAGGDWSLSFPASSLPADGAYTVQVRAVDTVGNAETPSSRSFTYDTTDPTGSLTTPADGAALGGSSVAVSSDSADAGSGIDQAEFQQRPAGGGAWTTIDTDPTAPYAVDWDTTPLADGDHDLRVLTTDHAGNTTTSPTHTVTVDNTAPSAPVVALSESSPFAYVSGTEIFVDTDESGSYDVEAASSDGASGIDKIRFPGPTDDSSSPYGVSYGFGALSGGQTVTAFNGVGLTASSPFTVTPDTAGPMGGSVDYPDGYDADGDVNVAVDAGDDALSGVAPSSAVLERRTASLSDGACDPFAGGWSPVTSPDTVASGLCAQYRYRVSDRVGNEAVYVSANVVKVDLVDPAAPILTLVESSPYAHVVGTQIFVNTAESGSYDIEAATSDALAGIDRVSFPGGIDDATAPYAATYGFGDLSGTETVIAHDGAGNVASADFEVTEDVSAPSTTDDTASIGPGWQTAPVTVTLTPADGGAGVAATYYTTDGSIPTTSSEEGTSIDLTADGVYVVRYFSVDNVGNAEPVQSGSATIRIDQTTPDAPSISLSESSPWAYAGGDEIFVNTNETDAYGVSATSSDAGSGIDKIVFPGGVEDSTSPYSATYDLDDLSGPQTVTVHDVAGLTAADMFTVTPDTAGPTGGSVDYPDGYDADGMVTVTVDAGADALAGVDAASAVIERRISALTDGVCDPFVGGWSAVTSPDTIADNTCAQYRYRVADRVGNEAILTLPTSTVKVDLTSPQTAIDLAPSDPSSDATPSFEFSSSEGDSTFECRLDGGAWGSCASPRSYAGLTDEGHTFQVRAADEARNIDGTPASHSWTIDTAAPNTSLDVAPPDPSDDGDPSFEFSSDEGGASFECRLDGGAWAPCTSPHSYAGLADGSHAFDLRATDAVGNVDGSPASHTWTVDTVAPDSSFTVVPADPSGDPTPTFEFTASEGGSTFRCRLDGDDWGACSSPATIGPLADGSHTLEARATDAAGNEETTPESYTWVVDAPPSVSITEPGTFVNASASDPYTVRATSPDGDVSGIEFFSCSDASVDCAGGTWVSLGTDATAPYETSWALDADGNRALRAVATDAASFTGSDVVNVTIDRTAPTTTIDAAPSDPASSADASFEFSSNEGGSSFECRLDGDAWNSCSSPQAYTGLSEGDHTLDVRALDAAGNPDPTPAATAWTVDTVAPETTLDATPNDPTADSAPSFEFSASEGGTTFECRLDSDPWGSCSSPEAYTGLADGSHTFRVRATDAAGNADGSPAEHTWTIDTTAPGGSLSDPGHFLGGTVALTAGASDGGAGVRSVDFQVSPANAGSWTSVGADSSSPYSVDWNTATLADGVYDLRIVVTDGAGNSGSSAVLEDRVVDNTAPAKPGGFKGIVSGSTFSLSWKPATDNSGVVSAYRIYANGVLVTTVGGSSLSAAMGPFRLTDTRAFQVAAVDAAGNVGAPSGKLKVVPKLTKLTLAAAKTALTARGFNVGKITYKASASVPKGRVIAGTAKGLRPAGSKIGLIVSKG